MGVVQAQAGGEPSMCEAGGDELSPDLLHEDELSPESPLCKPVEKVSEQRCWEFEAVCQNEKCYHLWPTTIVRTNQSLTIPLIRQ